MPDTVDKLSEEDLAALHEMQAQLTKSGDPRAAKVQQYIDTQSPPTQEHGFLGRAWDWANKGLISGDTLLNIAGKFQPKPDDMNPGESTSDYVKRQAQGNPNDSPTMNALKTGGFGIVKDAYDTASSFTSPVSIGTIGAGAATKAPGAIGKVAKVAAPVIAGAFAGKGAVDVVKNAPAAVHGDPDAAQKALMGGAMVAGGAAGLKATTPENPLNGAMAERMAEKPAGAPFSRAEVLQAAKDNGIKLDLAQATDHPVAIGLKKANQYSLASQGTYSNARAGNRLALENMADAETARYAPESADREVVGGQIQDALRKDLVEKKTAATEAFEDLDKRVGTNTIDATNTVEAQARQIVSENKAYYAKHPELVPKQAWSIVENLAQREKVTKVNPGATSPGLMDVNGNPVNATGTITQTPSKANFMTWSELHQLRSDLMDVYRNNPDMVKGQSERWLQTMVGTIDEAMTQSAGGLQGADLAKFREANANWENIKSTYDNPQSPLYQAIRSPYQSQVGSMLSRATPELARQVRKTLGAVEGPFQRQFVEQIINAKDGVTPDFANLATRLRRIPQDHLEAMIGKDGAKSLRMLGELSRKITADENPSGTAKVGVPASEVAGLFHSPLATGAELGAQYAGAKAMNSPKVINYLTSPATEAMMERSGWVRDASGRLVRRRP